MTTFTQRQRLAAMTLPLVIGAALLAVPAHAAPMTKLDCNVKITMRDGTWLSANVERPARPGRYPTLLTTTPYGKDSGNAEGLGARVPDPSSCAQPGTGDTRGLATSGYSVMTVDWRGSGNSEAGKYQTTDFVTDHEDLLDWVQRQPWSNGRVGATGCSNLGGSTMAMLDADQERMRAGKPRAVYAAWADSFFTDTYRAAVGPGAASTSPANFAVPALYGAGRLYLRPQDHVPGDVVPLAQDADQEVYYRLLGMQLDQSSYDEYWQKTDLTTYDAQIDVPVAMTGATDDLWQLGTIPMQTAMRLSKSPHAAYFMSPGGHCGTTLWETLTFGKGIHPGSKPKLVKMWFDRWLKGVHNGIDSLPNYNFHPVGAKSWTVQSATMPARGVRMTTLYFDNVARGAVADTGSMLTERPAAIGRDEMQCTVCGMTSDGSVGDNLGLRYLTKPVPRDTALAGVVEGTVYATFDRPDGAIAVNLLDVAPDGSAVHIVDAQIRARDRVVDWHKSLVTSSGLVLDPYHPLTVAARQVVNGVDAYHLTFTPAAWTVAKGHRIEARVTFTDPKFVLPANFLASMSGETMRVVHGGIQASEITLPIVSGNAVERRSSFNRSAAPIDILMAGAVRPGR
jgi:putative CocE/NonD family hydrolase